MAFVLTTGSTSNTPAPNPSNFFYRLSDNDALITVVQYPAKAAYFSYLSYVFTSATSHYPAQTTPPNPQQVKSPNPNRYEIFGSVGNAVNNVVVQNQNGLPWNGKVITHVTTSNATLADNIVIDLVAQGIDRNSIFIEKLGSNVRTGRDQDADDLMTLIRYALPEEQITADNWYASLSSNVLIYKVSKPSLSVVRYPPNQYTKRTGTDETSLNSALTELAGLLQAWSTTNQPPSSTGLSAATTTSPFKPTVNDVNGEPQGIVGSTCIADGTLCAGDNQDTSNYPNSPDFYLSSNSVLFVAGVDHNQFNNSSYISLSIYNAKEFAGIASSSQANVNAVGFNSGSLTGSDQTVGSAQSVLQTLGLYDSATPTLKSVLPKLYVALVSKNCSTVPVSAQYCINLNGDTLIPDDKTPISIFERSYIRPGDTNGADVNVMVLPQVIGPGKK